MLSSALNAVCRLNSRVGMVKRLGTTDANSMFSPCRLTPAFYKRNPTAGPEYTTVQDVEFIVPLATMTGQFAQLLTFARIPSSGQFKIQFSTNTTDFLNFDCTAADVQTALRLLTPLANVLVTGSFNTGFLITFVGFQTFPALGSIPVSTLMESGTSVAWAFTNSSVVWAEPLKKGDRLIDGSKTWTVIEVQEMNDLGAVVMGYRARCN